MLNRLDYDEVNTHLVSGGTNIRANLTQAYITISNGSGTWWNGCCLYKTRCGASGIDVNK